VRWQLAGIDEIERVRLRFDPERFDGFTGTGTIERRRGEIVWTPNGPYAELTYTVHVDHRRAPGKGYDSYAGEDWILSRTSGFFPRCAVLFRRDVEPHPESRARLVVRLPPGWTSATAMPAEAEARYVVETPHQRMDHPRGWLAFGRLKHTDATTAGTELTIVRVPGVTKHVEPIVDLMRHALPLITTLFEHALPRLLVVLGPDPMWRGGLSGEESFYMHADRPLRSPDYTSPYLHELFHVAAPFRPQPDAHWVTEGLAEYYSIELQRRIGTLSEEHFQRALELFARHGVWNQDFTHTGAPALRNNSAPLVMYVLDQRIRAATDGQRGLDAVVTSLARDGGAVSTARFLGTVQRVAGKSFAAFFRRHVYRGEEPAFSPAGR
jgi:predicted metalloprotease with PDZ domain